MRNRGDVKHAHHLNHYETWQPQHAHMYSLSLKLESMVAVAHQGPVLQPHSNDNHHQIKLVATADLQRSGCSHPTSQIKVLPGHPRPGILSFLGVSEDLPP
jgi:hypothetical protein